MLPLADLEHAGAPPSDTGQGRDFSPTNMEEDTIPLTDEEEAIIPPMDINQDTPVAPSAALTGEVAIEGSLVLDPEEARLELLKQAVSAIDVHQMPPNGSKRKRWTSALFIVIIIIVLAVVGVSLGVTLGRKSDPAETSSSDLQSASPTTAPTLAP